MDYDDIDMGQLCDVFLEEMHAGLKGRDSSLAMIPTYIEVGGEVGGTNFRVGAVSFDGSGRATVDNSARKAMPGIESEVSKEEFFATIVDYMAGVADMSERVGFCFSYPTEILPSRDGRLIRFCKEVKAREVEGELIGENLVAAMLRGGYGGERKVVILNDTVATLLAGVSASHGMVFDSYIGFILGTGSNCCYVESNRNITKTGGLDGEGEQIVNVESGAFGKAPRGAIDLLLDGSTLDPGQYTFEKMFSGAYLGPLCLEAFKKGGEEGLFSGVMAEKLSTAEGLQTKDVNSFMRHPQGENPLTRICASGTERDRATVWHVADCLIERAAKVVAVLLSSVVLKTDKGTDPCAPVCITAEGTTFYELKSLKSRIECYLRCFLQQERGRYFEIVSVEDATLIGAAIAGLTN